MLQNVTFEAQELMEEIQEAASVVDGLRNNSD
jgi:hypothetical protein